MLIRPLTTTGLTQIRDQILSKKKSVEFWKPKPYSLRLQIVSEDQTGLTHKTKETGFLAGDFADEIWISR